MRASRRVLAAAVVYLPIFYLPIFCLSNFCLSRFAAAQQTDRVLAERVLGPRWKQLSRRAGIIFAGTVLATVTPAVTAETAATQNAAPQTATTDRAVPGAIPAVQLRFRVDEAVAGVERGQVLTIHEWAGAWSMHRPMSKGQHILIFLYPPSRLGLTSPVGGSLGQVFLDSSGKNVSNDVQKPDALQKPAAAVGLRNASSPRPRVPVAAGSVSVLQLERAIRGARSEEE